MEYFVQQLINGLTLGAIYGLIAIGYTMVYGIIGLINFAHGDVFMVGAFIALIAFLALMAIGVTMIPLALLIVLILAMVLTAVWGWTVERVAYRPLRDSFRLAPLITAIGMSIVLQNFIQVAQGARVKPLQPVVTGGSYTEEGGAEGVRQLLATDQHPTAIFASNDLAALGCLQALADAGKSVPDDISLMGYDNAWLAGLQHISLTTIDQPRQELGATAVELLMERLEGGRKESRHIVLEPSLVVRATTAPPAKGL